MSPQELELVSQLEERFIDDPDGALDSLPGIYRTLPLLEDTQFVRALNTLLTEHMWRCSKAAIDRYVLATSGYTAAA